MMSAVCSVPAPRVRVPREPRDRGAGGHGDPLRARLRHAVPARAAGGAAAAVRGGARGGLRPGHGPGINWETLCQEIEISLV